MIIDTRIPCKDGVPVYARSSQKSNMCVSIVEKAYAKLKGTYENLNGGNTSEAMVELTGGVSEKVNLKLMEPRTDFWNFL